MDASRPAGRGGCRSGPSLGGVSRGPQVPDQAGRPSPGSSGLAERVVGRRSRRGALPRARSRPGRSPLRASASAPSCVGPFVALHLDRADPGRLELGAHLVRVADDHDRQALEVDALARDPPDVLDRDGLDALPVVRQLLVGQLVDGKARDRTEHSGRRLEPDREHARRGSRARPRARLRRPAPRGSASARRAGPSARER